MLFESDQYLHSHNCKFPVHREVDYEFLDYVYRIKSDGGNFNAKTNGVVIPLQRLGWESKIESMQEDNAGNRWVDLFISFFIPN